MDSQPSTDLLNVPTVQLFLTLTTFAFIAVANGAVVTFSTGLGCNSVSQTFRGDCNFCADPPFDWSSISFSEISGNNRVTVHNQDRCTPASQVGQGFGPACWNQGATKLRSAWVACPGQRIADNTTVIASKASVVDA